MPECIIVVEGVFDGPAARRVEAQLAREQAGARILLDLSKVREFHDFAIGILALVLARVPGVAVRGLRTHQLRMLRYFGLDADALARTAVADAAYGTGG
jgi:hypothetical protein